MATDFSIKTFLRNVSPNLLQQFFKKHYPLSDFDWSLKDEAFIEALYQSIDHLPKEPKAHVQNIFEAVHEFSDADAIVCVMDIIRTLHPGKAEVIIDTLIKHKGPHDQLLWLSLQHPEVMEWAMRLERMEDMKFKQECLVGKHPAISTDMDTLNAFQELLQKVYKRQKRGYNCQIDAYVRENPKRYCFFAYPEDHAKRDLKYKTGKLTTALRWPVMEHVFIYEPESEKLRISAGRIRDVKPMQDAFCKAVLGLEGVPDGSTKIYDLSLLMKSEFQFSDNLEHPIEQVSLRTLKAVVKNDDSKKRRLTCEGEPENGGTELLRTMMSKAAMAIGVNPDKLIITNAKITIVFRNPDGGRKPVTFYLTSAGGTTLEEKEYHHYAHQYLEEWGLAKLLLPKEDEAA